MIITKKRDFQDLMENITGNEYYSKRYKKAKGRRDTRRCPYNGNRYEGKFPEIMQKTGLL